MIRCLFFFSLIISAFCLHAKVSIQVEQDIYNFPDNPSLLEVLLKVTKNQQWYWPASALYRLDSLSAENQRNEIINQLTFIQISLNDKNSAQLNMLVEQIKQWNVADRINIKIDFDAAQMNANNNPRFNSGKYKLELVTRPKTAHLFGLTAKPLIIDLTNNQCAHNYIHQLVPDLVEQDIAYIIQPDGLTKKIGIAYWNKDCVDVMPGSQIYLPLPESQFFKENRLLNEKIIALAKNRIVQ